MLLTVLEVGHSMTVALGAYDVSEEGDGGHMKLAFHSFNIVLIVKDKY